jgi:hypothetical protein
MGEVEAAVRSSKAEANPLFVSVDEEREPAEKRWAAVRAHLERETASYGRSRTATSRPRTARPWSCSSG